MYNVNVWIMYRPTNIDTYKITYTKNIFYGFIQH